MLSSTQVYTNLVISAFNLNTTVLTINRPTIDQIGKRPYDARCPCSPRSRSCAVTSLSYSRNFMKSVRAILFLMDGFKPSISERIYGCIPRTDLFNSLNAYAVYLEGLQTNFYATDTAGSSLAISTTLYQDQQGN
ncbi:unnamed protein product [Adineta ricciae]|uniref:Uncharacterized protein n=1 Tax=Adineta ricciae TaxID=249248 RepID=A0A815Q6T6_ADIRI|nr:unnamed protein product [Adineta ricciae]CAF1459105.1 unnamed protein product [Adineta ricciae]